MSNFNVDRSGTGTREWAEYSENVCVGCSNDCLYCYAAKNADSSGKRSRSEWYREEISNSVSWKKYPKKSGVVMLPTTHDVTPFNVDAVIERAVAILDAGNDLLLVSKPRLEPTRKLMAALSGYKEHLLFRFTIGTLNTEVSKFWEPNAPSPHERILCLREAWGEGFKTSVSCEPMLEGVAATVDLYKTLYFMVTDTFWIGKMNRIDDRVDLKYAEMAEIVKLDQSDNEIAKLYSILCAEPKVRWKDSIKQVIAKRGIQL